MENQQVTEQPAEKSKSSKLVYTFMEFYAAIIVVLCIVGLVLLIVSVILHGVYFNKVPPGTVGILTSNGVVQEKILFPGNHLILFDDLKLVHTYPFQIGVFVPKTPNKPEEYTKAYIKIPVTSAGCIIKTFSTEENMVREYFSRYTNQSYNDLINLLDKIPCELDVNLQHN